MIDSANGSTFISSARIISIPDLKTSLCIIFALFCPPCGKDEAYNSLHSGGIESNDNDDNDDVTDDNDDDDVDDDGGGKGGRESSEDGSLTGVKEEEDEDDEDEGNEREEPF